MAFAENTLVIKNNCHTASIADIKPGDVLMTPSGEAEVVVAEKAGTAYPLFKVSSPDSYYTVTKDHVLNLICGKAGLKDVLGNEMYFGETFNISIEDYLAREEDFRANVGGYHAMPSFPYKDPDFPPYEYGVLMSYERLMGRVRAKYNKDTLWIPISYLRNSRIVRAAFLAGYTDGCGEFDGESLTLPVSDGLSRHDLVFLAKSLGLDVDVSDGNVLKVSGNLKELKTEFVKLANTECFLHYRIEIEPVGEGVTYKLELKDNTHLLLMDDFSVVHDCNC